MLRKTILNTISIDIVEMIIVSSKDYKLYETLRLLLIKLYENNRTVRIKDKLTICENIGNGAYKYYLNNKSHREYDKPSIIDDISTTWHKNNRMNRINDNPSMILFKDNRNWYYMRTNDYPTCILLNGDMCWLKIYTLYRKKSTTWLWHTGYREYMGNKYKYVNVFDYLSESYCVSITNTK